jgi:hypothetical protein
MDDIDYDDFLDYVKWFKDFLLKLHIEKYGYPVIIKERIKNV